ncbi:MAG: chorismate synthase [Acutalibacteraceae bacterium]
MKNVFGNNFTLTLFGESHGAAIGCVLDGVPSGIEVDEEFIFAQMEKRKGINQISTKRREADKVKILSGVFFGKTTGTPICFLIENGDTKSKDYSKTATVARPGHADFTAQMRYGGFQDFRGGGHFSGRLTAPIVAAGALAVSMLKSKGIRIGTHISSCKDICDRKFENLCEDIEKLDTLTLPVLCEKAREDILSLITETAKEGDSVGGILETVAVGLPAGVGEPWFDTVESVLSHGLFSIPAVKGVEFGSGFDFCKMYGSQANDPFYFDGETVKTKTNNNGGINGGITNGMPLQFKVAIKPTPSIYKKQDTVDFKKMENTTLQIEGRHDPAIIHRAVVVVNSITAITLCDLLITRFGTDFFGK